jgi:hypothetical protein
MYADPLMEEAYRRWKVIRYRCNNPKAMHYRYYGGKGIKMKIPSKTFIEWYLCNKPKDSTKVWSIGRIDHDKDYTLDNISFITQSDNIKERNHRNGLPINENNKNAVVMIDKITGIIIKQFFSQAEASKYLKLSNATITAMVKYGLRSTKRNFVLKKKEI